jgi:hypothetical protein
MKDTQCLLNSPKRLLVNFLSSLLLTCQTPGPHLLTLYITCRVTPADTSYHTGVQRHTCWLFASHQCASEYPLTLRNTPVCRDTPADFPHHTRVLRHTCWLLAYHTSVPRHTCWLLATHQCAAVHLLTHRKIGSLKGLRRQGSLTAWTAARCHKRFLVTVHHFIHHIAVTTTLLLFLPQFSSFAPQ